MYHRRRAANVASQRLDNTCHLNMRIICKEYVSTHPYIIVYALRWIYAQYCKLCTYGLKRRYMYKHVCVCACIANDESGVRMEFFFLRKAEKFHKKFILFELDFVYQFVAWIKYRL